MQPNGFGQTDVPLTREGMLGEIRRLLTEAEMNFARVERGENLAESFEAFTRTLKRLKAVREEFDRRGYRLTNEDA